MPTRRTPLFGAANVKLRKCAATYPFWVTGCSFTTFAPGTSAGCRFIFSTSGERADAPAANASPATSTTSAVVPIRLPSFPLRLSARLAPAFQRPLHLTLRVAVGDVAPLVALLLAAGDCELHFYPAVLEVKPRRHDRQA